MDNGQEGYIFGSLGWDGDPWQDDDEELLAESRCDTCYNDCEACPLMRAHMPTAMEATVLEAMETTNHFGV